MPGGYGNYTPYRARWSTCFDWTSSGNMVNPNARCPRKVYSLNTKNVISNVDGIDEIAKIKTPVVPIWMRYSALINSSTYRNGGQKLIYKTIELNEYGSYAGAPAGYGQPPRNTFN
jgi:hypothetical protein